MKEIEKVELLSLDIAYVKRQQLRGLFPEVFNELGIDFDKLKQVLGELVEPAQMRFGLQWAGKRNLCKPFKPALMKP